MSPSVISEFQSTGMWPTERNPCLLCQRAEELEQLTRKIKASEDYVFSLKLGQLLSHVDLELVFKYLPNLSNLELTYGSVREVSPFTATQHRSEHCTMDHTHAGYTR